MHHDTRSHTPARVRNAYLLNSRCITASQLSGERQNLRYPGGREAGSGLARPRMHVCVYLINPTSSCLYLLPCGRVARHRPSDMPCERRSLCNDGVTRSCLWRGGIYLPEWTLAVPQYQNHSITQSGEGACCVIARGIIGVKLCRVPRRVLRGTTSPVVLAVGCRWFIGCVRPTGLSAWELAARVTF